MDHRTTDLARQVEKYYPDTDFEWLDDLKVRCKGATLLITQGFYLSKPEEGETILFKDPEFLSAYVELFRGRRFANVVEVGVYNGGSAIFFWNLLKPANLCCIDISEQVDSLTDYVEAQNLQEAIGTYFDTDQSDQPRMKQALDDQFGSEPIDLVIDDASHLYGPSLATFEVIFPRMRPGGLYVLEDWKMHLAFPDAGRDPDTNEPKIHRLVQELVDVAIGSYETISDVVIHNNFAVFTRGDGDLDPDSFSVTSILDSASERLER